MRRFTLLAVVALISLSANSAFACRCATPPPPKQSLAKSKAVFLGKVIRIEKTKPRDFGVSVLRVTFEVSRNFKNVTKRQVDVITSASGASCGYNFTKGKTYLVYCLTAGGEKSLTTNLCSRTRPEKNAK